MHNVLRAAAVWVWWPKTFSRRRSYKETQMINLPKCTNSGCTLLCLVQYRNDPYGNRSRKSWPSKMLFFLVFNSCNFLFSKSPFLHRKFRPRLLLILVFYSSKKSQPFYFHRSLAAFTLPFFLVFRSWTNPCLIVNSIYKSEKSKGKLVNRLTLRRTAFFRKTFQEI